MQRCNTGSVTAHRPGCWLPNPNRLLGLYAAITWASFDGKNPDGWIPEEKTDLARGGQTLSHSTVLLLFLVEAPLDCDPMTVFFGRLLFIMVGKTSLVLLESRARVCMRERQGAFGQIRTLKLRNSARFV